MTSRTQKAAKGCITVKRKYWFVAGLVDTVFRESGAVTGLLGQSHGEKRCSRIGCDAYHKRQRQPQAGQKKKDANDIQ